MSWEELFMLLYGREAFICPVCKKGKMVVIESVSPQPRASPLEELQSNYSFLMQ
jgi:hypothetical protein